LTTYFVGQLHTNSSILWLHNLSRRVRERDKCHKGKTSSKRRFPVYRQRQQDFCPSSHPLGNIIPSRHPLKQEHPYLDIGQHRINIHLVFTNVLDTGSFSFFHPSVSLSFFLGVGIKCLTEGVHLHHHRRFNFPSSLS